MAFSGTEKMGTNTKCEKQDKIQIWCVFNFVYHFGSLLIFAEPPTGSL